MRKAIVRIFDPAMVRLSGSGIDFESVEPPEIDSELLEQFESRILSYRYELSSNKDGLMEYKCIKTKSWSLKVLISKNQISFTCPSTKQYNSSLLFESFQTASELCDHDRLALLNCSRDKEWMNLDHLQV